MQKFVRRLFAAALGAVILSCGESPTGPNESGSGLTVGKDAVTSEGAGGPTVTTDKSDYMPGDTVQVTGMGWQPNETIALVLSEDPAVHEPTIWNVVADSLGTFVDRSFGIEDSHVGVAFNLVATGAASADTAQGMFTDGNFAVKTNFGTMKINWDWYGNTGCTGASSGGANNVDINTSSSILVAVGATQSAKVNVTNAPAGTAFVSMTSGGNTRTTTTECFAGVAGSQTWTANFAFLSTTIVTANVASPRTAGDPITFTATVTKNLDNSALSAGSVAFYDGGTCAAPGALLQASTNLPGSGIVSFVTTALSAGPHTILACYSGSTAGDPDILASNGSIPYTINPASVATTTSVGASPASPSEFGTSVTFTATVTQTSGGAAVTTGNVSFHDASCAGTELQAAAAVDGSGQKTYTTSSLAVGAHTVVACYEGATGFDASNGSTSYTINKIVTGTAVTADKTTPQPVGTSIVFTATVTRSTGGAAVALGNVRFIEGGSCASPTTVLQAGTAVNGSGQVTYTTSGLSVGSHTIAACYDGDTNYAISDGSKSFTIDAAATSTSVTPNPASPREYGTSVTFTAAVTSGGSAVTSGNVRFIEGGTCDAPTTTLKSATAVNSSGEVAYTTTSLGVASHTIRACYDGVTNYAPSTGTAGYTINKIGTTTTLGSDVASPQPAGATVVFTAEVNRTTGGANVTAGNVAFYDGGSCTTPGTLLQAAGAVDGDGKKTLSTNALSIGAHTVVACYFGNDTLSASGDSKEFTIAKIQTTTTVTPSPISPIEYGTSVTFTAEVNRTSGGTDVTTGSVTFYEGGDCTTPGAQLKSATAVSGTGTATFTSTNLSVGSHSVLACYGGDATYEASHDSESFSVNKIGTATLFSANPSGSQEFGTEIVFTAEVNRSTGGANVTQGSVAFYEGGTCTSVGTQLQAAGAVDGDGKKTYTTSSLSIGNHSIVACYEGNDTLATSTDSEALTITKILTTTTVTPSPVGPVQYGTNVTFSAEVNKTNGGGDVTAGNITFRDGADCSTGSIVKASEAVSGTGTASFSSAALGVGAHNILACYEGNSTYEESSHDASLTVTKIGTATTLSVLPTSPQLWNTSLVFTAEVNRSTGGSDVNQGNVAFYEGGSCDTPGPVLQAAGAVDGDGKKTFTTSSLSVGNHTILACYLGNDTLATSNDSEPFTINKIPTSVTLTLTPGTSQQYSDSVTLSASITPNDVAGSVQFMKSVGGGAYSNIGSAVTVASGAASLKYQILESSAQSLSFKSVFTPDDADHYTTDDDSKSLTVTKENAQVGFASGNPAALQVSAPGGTLDPNALTLVVTLREKTPDLATGGTAAGAISNATLAVSLNPIGGGAGVALNCTNLSNGLSGYAEVITYTCKNGGALIVNTYQVDATVPATNNYYVGGDTDAFTVFDPSLGFATGGGTFNLDGDRVNFGFTMKYTKSGTNLQGNLIAVRHHPDGTVSRIKSNSLGGLALSEASGCGIAQFNGKATYSTWSSSINDYVNTGNNTFYVYGKDCNNPGTGLDYIWIDGPGNLDMPGNGETGKQQLTGGNIAVPHKPAR